jgi:hypothetical protein
LTRAHAAETLTVQELRGQIEEMGDVWIELEGMREERNELAERLDMVRGEVVAALQELLLDNQRQTEDMDAQLNILAVQQTELMREIDEQNAATDIAILQLREDLRTACLEEVEEDDEGDDEEDSEHEIELQEDSITQARSEDRDLIESHSNIIKEGEQLREAKKVDVADAQICGGDIRGRSRDHVAATEDIRRNETAFEAIAVTDQVPKVKPGKPPKPTCLSSA